MRQVRLAQWMAGSQVRKAEVLLTIDRIEGDHLQGVEERYVVGYVVVHGSRVWDAAPAVVSLQQMKELHAALGVAIEKEERH